MYAAADTLDDLSGPAVKAVLRGWVLGTPPVTISTLLMSDFGHIVDPTTVAAGYALLEQCVEMRICDLDGHRFSARSER